MTSFLHAYLSKFAFPGHCDDSSKWETWETRSKGPPAVRGGGKWKGLFPKPDTPKGTQLHQDILLLLLPASTGNH